jgi:hypothetical protein
VVDGLFLVGMLLMVGYGVEMILWISARYRKRRVFHVLTCLWFVVLGIYVLVAISPLLGVLIAASGPVLYYVDKRVAPNLL